MTSDNFKNIFFRNSFSSLTSKFLTIQHDCYFPLLSQGVVGRSPYIKDHIPTRYFYPVYRYLGRYGFVKDFRILKFYITKPETILRCLWWEEHSDYINIFPLYYRSHPHVLFLSLVPMPRLKTTESCKCTYNTKILRCLWWKEQFGLHQHFPLIFKIISPTRYFYPVYRYVRIKYWHAIYENMIWKRASCCCCQIKR